MSRRAKIILGIVGVVVIAGAGATIAFWPAVSGFVTSIFKTEQLETNPDEQPDTSAAIVDPEIEREAVLAAIGGDTKKAIAVYDRAIGETDDTAMKAELYMKKAQVYGDANDTSAALSAAEQAYAIDTEGLGPITLLALLYEKAGQYSKAAELYRKAADLIVLGEDPTAPLTKEYFLESAARLEAL